MHRTEDDPTGPDRPTEEIAVFYPSDADEDGDGPPTEKRPSPEGEGAT